MQVIAIVVPMVFIIGVYVKRRNVYDLDRDLHHAILGKFLTLASHFFFFVLGMCLAIAYF